MPALKHLLIPACLLCLYPVGSAAQTASRFSILITEIMADPSPVTGLPNSEYIELKNNSAQAISLQHWKIADGSGAATFNTNFVFQPDSMVIICPNAAVTQFAAYGAAIGIAGFPSLNNEGEIIALYSPEGKVIHAIDYASTWYQNDVKSDGGWSLEMMDTNNPCGGMSNWKASIDAKGGTPGAANSVTAANRDDIFPALQRTYPIDSNTIAAVFEEQVDSLSASAISNYAIDKNMGTPVTAIPVPPLFKEVLLTFPKSFLPNTIYRLTVNNVSDCAGNTIGSFNTALSGLPSPATTSDIVINEILFNPKPGGYDYLEIYNRSNKIIDLQEISICNVGSNLTNIRRLSEQSKLFFPGDYLVFTENTWWLRQNYTAKNENQLAALPSMPDDDGHISLINRQGDRIDGLHYTKQWHFALIDDPEGISLERIDYNDSTQQKNNWTSAAATAGFGTPGYQNSQFRTGLLAQGQVSVFPAIFSPDNSGIDDFLGIKLQLPEPGYFVTITIFDNAGRVVRHLVRNITAGNRSIFNWDGLDNLNKKLPVGHYIILTEIVNLQGKTKKFKHVVTLAARL